MQACAISCSELFQFYQTWQNLNIEYLCQYVQPVIMGTGVCYTFNMMPTYQLFNEKYQKRYTNFFNITYNNTLISKWNIDDGYSKYSEIDSLVDETPKRTNGVSYQHQLSLFVSTLPEEFVPCTENADDDYVVVSLSGPMEYYSETRSYNIQDTYSKIQIIPFIKKIDWDIRWQSLEARKCYLHNERKLTIFQIYTQLNCDKECEINETIIMCGCVDKDAALNPSIKICGPLKMDCVQRVKGQIALPGIQNVCNCKPMCSWIRYDKTDAYHSLDREYYQKTKLEEDVNRGVFIDLAFKNPHFTAYKVRSVVHWNSLISTLGGILSIFLGINLLNLFEIFFFLIQIANYYFSNLIHSQ